MSTTPPAAPTTQSTQSSAVRMSSGVVASLAGAGALLVFMLQNREDVTLSFLFWDFTWPLWLLILVTALLGAVIWIGLGVLRRRRRRAARRQA